MPHRRYTQLVAMVLVATSAAIAATPVSPYKALNLPNAVNPTLHVAPVQAITIGPLSIDLEVTPLSFVQEQFCGVKHKAGDAGNAVNWLCYAGKTGQMPVIYWFASNNEMAGSQHQVTQIAIQTDPGGNVPEGCGSAPSTLAGINFGVPSIGATLDAVVKHFWRRETGREGKPQLRQ